MADKREVRQSVVIETTPELAFAAVTKAAELREWFTDEAWTQIQPNGRFDVRWNSGFRSDGRFLELESPRRAIVTWQGTAEPGQTTVEFSVEAVEEGVRLTVIHRGFGPGAEWDKALAASQTGWVTGLENLKSVLEAGIDQRTARRPFLGITLSLLDPERAAKEGIAAEQGIYIEGTMEGSGAAASGIRRGDVFLSVGGTDTVEFEGLQSAIDAHRPGEAVDVVLVRGQTRLTIPVTLGHRPVPELFSTAEALADRLAARHDEVNAALHAVLEGATDEEASQCPAPGEWSAKQVLAHLSAGERASQEALGVCAVHGWYDADGYEPNDLPGRLDAALAVTPSLQGLVERFVADQAETVALLRALPQATVAHKARFRRIAQNVLYGPDHTRDHIEQIANAIRAARGS